MKTLPVAVQVYSVRDDAERDFKGTMQKIKDMGYDGVELAGLYGMKPAEVKAILEEVGLVPLSAHVPFQELEADIEGTVAQYKEIGMQYIAIPYLMEEDRPGTEKFLKNIETFKKIGEACKMYELIGIETEKKEETGKFEFRPVGHGMQDIPPVLDAALEAGSKWVVVEQDQSYDTPALEAVKMSRDYLKGLGW